MNTNILFDYIKRTFRFIARKQFSFYRDFAKVRTTKLFLDKSETISPSLYNDNVNAYLVIFSKDRALQLHALLGIYTIKVTNNKNIFILYTTSNYQHENSYRNIISLYELNPLVHFIREKHFRKDLIKIISKNKLEKVILGCNDSIFSKDLDLNDFCRINPKIAVGSLYRGLDVTFCMVKKRELPLPPFYKFNNDIFLKDKLVWKWNETDRSLHWGYPIAVGFHLFDRRELLHILKFNNFHAPNSFEGNLQIWYPFFKNKYGISYVRAMISSTPFNLVNIEVVNITSDGFSADELLSKWNAGLRLYYEEYDNLEETEAILHKPSFINRKI